MELDRKGMEKIIQDFERSARYADQAGFDKRLCERRDGGTLRRKKAIALVQPRGELVGVSGAFDQ